MKRDSGTAKKSVPKNLIAVSLEYLSGIGWLCDRVEGKQGRISRDLFGIADILALRRGVVRLVQVTSRSHVSDRAKKIERSPITPLLRQMGVQIHVHGWDFPGGIQRVRLLDLSKGKNEHEGNA